MRPARRTEGGKPDHVDGDMGNAAMHEGIADKREKRCRIGKAVRQRKARRYECEIQHELIVLLLADNVVLIDIDRRAQGNQGSHHTGNIEYRLAAARPACVAAHFPLRKAHELLLSKACLPKVGTGFGIKTCAKTKLKVCRLNMIERDTL